MTQALAHLDIDSAAGVATVTIDNPASRNGLTGDSAAHMASLIDTADAHEDVRCIVLTGAGEHFCSGADLKHGAKDLAKGDEALREHVGGKFHSVIRTLNRTRHPTIAVIRGACVGFGFDLTLHCDLRVCADDSKFGQVFKRIGLVPDGGSSYMLPRIVGLGRAMELMLLAETFDGQRAAELGIVNRSVPEPALSALAEDWAHRLAQGPPLAYREGRANLRAGAGDTSLEEALGREVESQLKCLRSKDMARGIQAFFAKKPPEFQGD